MTQILIFQYIICLLCCWLNAWHFRQRIMQFFLSCIKLWIFKNDKNSTYHEYSISSLSFIGYHFFFCRDRSLAFNPNYYDLISKKNVCCLSTCNPPSPYHSYPSLSSSSVDIGRKAKKSKTLLMKNRLNSSWAECSEEPTSMSWLSTALTEIWLRRRLLLARIVEFWIYCTYIPFLLIARIIFCCYNNSTFEIACSIFPFQILF